MGNIDLTPVFVLAGIGVIFGLWKIIELIIWIVSHVHISF
jgi:hypothetical protein